MLQNTSSNIQCCINSLAIVAIVAIISIMICCLAALGFNSKVTVQKEKIEINTANTNNSNPN